MYNALLAVPDHDRYDTSSLLVCVSGGASLPVETLRSFDEAFGCKVLEAAVVAARPARFSSVR